MRASRNHVLSWDRAHLWHPYSSVTSPGPVHEVVSASGVRLRLRVDGRELEVVDAMSSWWCAIHGYAVPELDAAVHDQLRRMSHVMFGGLTHEPAVELGRRLVELSGLPHVFLADSGSVSVEVAMKMAWQAQAGTGRTTFLTVRGGYHGDTFSPMSVCDPEGGMHSMYAGIVPEHVFAPLPPADDDGYDDWAAATTTLFAEHADEIAAVIVEPLLQGAGGMRPWSARCVDHLSRLAREHGALVVHDEIATGFWRTGTALAQDRLDLRADIVCVGKALTGGYLTLAATLCTAEVAQRVSASPAGAMMHGPTFMGNPLACAVANASLDLLATYDNEANIRRLEEGLRRGLAPAVDAPGVVDVRTLGAVGVVDFDAAVDVPKVTERALERGVWLRPFRNLVYTMPPYVTSDEDLAVITDAICEVVVSAFEDWLSRQAAQREHAGLTRRLVPRHPSEPVIDLAGNDYLGLARHPLVVEGAVAAAREYGAGAGASRLVTGSLIVHEELEQALASFSGFPTALAFSTGYHANLSAVAALTDADTLVVSDAHVHASMIDACRLSRATVHVVPHNDVAAVDAALAARTHQRAVVLVESIYSVLGDAAPVAALAEVCAARDAVLIADEAHGLGVAGHSGRGLVHAAGLGGAPHVVATLTLSKSLGAQGGAVLSTPAVREHLVNRARPFIYDTGLAPAAAGGALAALRVVEAEPQRVARVNEISAVLADACGVEPPAGAVLAVPMPGPLEAVAAVEKAAGNGVRIGCFRPPSTPDGISRLRLTAHAQLDDDELARAVGVLDGLL